MKFCPEHWQQLRETIEASGLTALIAEDGTAAVKNLASELKDGATIDNFDPLMAAHNMIWSRAMTEIAEKYQQNPLMLMADEADHPGWACPICALNWCHAEHDRLCKQENCDYPPNYDWAPEMMSVVGAVQERWKEMRP